MLFFRNSFQNSLFFWLPLAYGLTAFHGCLNEQVSLQNLGSNPKLTEYVDTRSGSGGILWTSGNTSPAACVPSGRIKVGPDTMSLRKMSSTSGYQYGDTEILGFSHTRYSGTGAYDGGSLRVIPVSKALSFDGLRKNFLLFTHSKEVAIPGFYSVTTEEGTKVELTATDRVAWHRYTIPGSTPHLVFELTSHFSAGGTSDVKNLTIDPVNQQISFSTLLLDSFSARYEGLETYFVITFDAPLVTHAIVSKNGSVNDLTASSNDGPTYLDLGFATQNPINLKVAISHVDIAGATNNLNTEVVTPGKTFDQVKSDADLRWQTILSRVVVEGGQLDFLRNFYQNFYRTWMMPAVYSDAPAADGTRSYRGFDRAVHQSTFNYYTELSLWDQFRTLFPLYHLIAPSESSDVVNSMLLMGDQSGALPRWAGGEGHTDSMLGQPATIIISEAFLKGITGFDVNKAYSMMLSAASPEIPAARGKECLAEFKQFGYCPQDVSNDSVSYTLEYSYSYYALYLMATSLGKTEAQMLKELSGNYKNLWDPSRLAFVPKTKSGVFDKSFNIEDNSYLGLTKASHAYREGSPNHYRWHVPYDPQGLIALYQDNFLRELTQFFEKAPQVPSSVYPNSYYWHGNEPDIQSVLLFSWAGRPDLTQKWSRWILSRKYRTTSMALEGQDDGGTLSAWYVLSALGIFPVAGTTHYVITSPIFPKATVNLGAVGTSATLTITASPDPVGNIYVCGATLNGRILTQPWFEHSDISAGGSLAFAMSPVPCAWRQN